MSTENIMVNGVRVAVRRFGSGEPIVLLNRFRGTLDNWDPALVTALARERQVIAFDSVGIGETQGETPATVEPMTDFAASVIRTLGLNSADILGWSLGGFIAQVLGIKYPHLVRKLVLAATMPPTGSPEVVWSPTWLERTSNPTPSVETAIGLFFTNTDVGRSAGRAVFGRMVYPSAASVSPAAMAAQAKAIHEFANEHQRLVRASERDRGTYIGYKR